MGENASRSPPSPPCLLGEDGSGIGRPRPYAGWEMRAFPIEGINLRSTGDMHAASVVHNLACAFPDDHFKNGRIALEGTAAELRENAEVKAAYLSL